MSSFLRISSCATSSLTHMMRLQPVIFVQTVATCPWIRRSSMRQNAISMMKSPLILENR